VWRRGEERRGEERREEERRTRRKNEKKRQNTADDTWLTREMRLDKMR
jgi:hypothetical protein